MTLAASRIVFQGETPYAHEREAIDFAIHNIPNYDPYHLWALLELIDPSTGRLYELDLLVLGYSALYLIEVKSGPGVYKGDSADWWRTPPGDGERPRYMDPPLRLTNHKAKVLKSRLRAHMRDPRLAPRVEALVFLSHPDTDISGLSEDGRVAVVTRRDFARAVTHHEFPGVNANRKPQRIDRKAARDVAEALRAIGLKAREGKAHVGSYTLGSVLEEGPGYQDRLAEHREAKMFRRARTYMVPQETSIERRQQLRRAANREAQLLYDVREHAGVLQITDYLADAELGPTVLFDDFEGGVPLPTFMRAHPELPLDDRAQIIEGVGRALVHCHKKSVIHSALSPHAVLVRRHPTTGAIETRLFNFQLGIGAEVEATMHWSALADEPWALYQAPELREDPSARSAASDVFSLGALAYFVFTGRPPGDSLTEVITRLATDRCLDPHAVANDLHENLAELICDATQLTPIHRLDEVEFVVETMLELLTQPDAEKPAVLDPLDAPKGEILDGDLTAEGVLGHGATSRVLLVSRDDRQYALKVSLGSDHDERLDREADVLEKLRHPRIVQLAERRTIANRRCLLMSVAGSETLQRHLVREGTVSLDLASRYGEELLMSLEHLEDEQVMHRDIKPANIGVGTATKKGYHLTLFDFSLSFAPLSDVSVGTAVYRDPFLAQRGAWDFFAERWSAAVTLHEMLTGTRPQYGDERTPAIDRDANLVLAAERFDPAVRDRLVPFFERALARDTDSRFPSAKTMRHAWIACFETPLPVAQSAEPPEPAELDDDAVRAIGPDTPLGALPLSTRARNALDRCGILRAGDLPHLADNHLSAMRGIGSRVAKEILTFRNRWREIHDAAPAAEPFYPGYAGADLMLVAADLEPSATTALMQAGFRTLGAVASAPEPQIRGLAQRHGFSAGELREALEHEHTRATEGDAPTSIDGWIDVLLPPDVGHSKLVRALFGLQAPFLGKLDVFGHQVAEHFGKTRVDVSLAVKAARKLWRKRATLRDVQDGCHALLEDAGGAMPITKMADELLARWPGPRHAAAAAARAGAGALIRICCELDREDPDGIRLLRLRDDMPWILSHDELPPIIRSLGAAADRLARRDVLASPGEAHRVLAGIVETSPLGRLNADRLTELAAAASREAARSPRLELYPRGMPATRALELSAAVLKGGLSDIHVCYRVRARYPDAAPLPDRPALDDLLAAYDLHWSDQTRQYERPGAVTASNLHTTLSTMTQVPTSLPGAVKAPSPVVIARKDFEDRMKNALERGSLRILGVTNDRADTAAVALSRVFDLEIRNLDTLFISAIREQIKQLNIPSDDVVHDADREGPAGKAWNNLLHLATRAADAVAADIFPAKRPMLLIQPGLIARYRLEGFLDKLVAASKDDASEAIMLLVPGHDTGGIPAINGVLSIQGVQKAQSMWIPRPWLAAVTRDSAA